LDGVLLLQPVSAVEEEPHRATGPSSVWIYLGQVVTAVSGDRRPLRHCPS
jgi:hypothetical protein